MPESPARDSSSDRAKKPTRYVSIITTIFQRHFRPDSTQFGFTRDEFVATAKNLGIDLPKNLGDLLYSFRFRTELPAEIIATAPPGKEWLIELAGRGRYRFRLAPINRIVPRSNLVA